MAESETGTSLARLFAIFLRLGLTSFGGPIAHLGYFREEFVARRRWLDDDAYADLVALCQFLPGPASSQVGMAVGLMRGGYAGALAAWAGFTLPSALLMTLFALGVTSYSGLIPPALLHGLRVVAVAVVAQAVWGMARTLCVGGRRIFLMASACVLMLLVPGAATQLWVIVGAALTGLALFPSPAAGGAGQSAAAPAPDRGRRTGAVFLAVFFLLLLVFPLLSRWPGGRALEAADAFYRAGSLVFGGGNVILPLLQAEVVTPGWVANDVFAAGYGAAQAVPGPLLSFAAFLGAAMNGPSGGVAGAAVCLAAIFAPAFLLIVGAWPYWDALRRNRLMRSALAGVNAAVVGLLLAALYQPLWLNAIFAPRDFALGFACWALLAFAKWPSWLVVFAGVAGAMLLSVL